MKVILCTTPKDKSEDMAQILLEEKLVSCVNIIPAIRSIYWWNGQIQKDTEDLLIIKTKDDLVNELIEKVKEVHPYDIPEVISLNVEDGNNDYIKWIDSIR
ncbi:MAG: divalent-cation tolerance protein CutA [Candidatus Sericytochromatia bacterium]